jgi:hypothetical protein
MPAVCSDCKTSDQNLLYSSGKTLYCKDCKRFRNLKDNSGVKRTYANTPALIITKTEFDDWKSGRARRCYYCNIAETDLKQAGLKSQTNKPIEALGIDRLDSNGDYTKNNIVYCCFACNKAKGNIFSSDEMKEVGKAISNVWRMKGIVIP